MNRCTGHCCQVFSLPHSPEKLRSFEWWSTGGQQRQVAGMAMHLGAGADLARRRSRALVHTGDDCGARDAAPDYYTCLNYDWLTGNCGIYEDRPPMCSDYPYGRRCKYPGCTWDEARRPRKPAAEVPYDGRVLRVERGRPYLCSVSAEREINRAFVVPVGDETPLPERLDAPLREKAAEARVGLLRRLHERMPWRLRSWMRSVPQRARWAVWRLRIEVAQDTHWMRTP